MGVVGWSMEFRILESGRKCVGGSGVCQWGVRKDWCGVGLWKDRYE